MCALSVLGLAGGSVGLARLLARANNLRLGRWNWRLHNCLLYYHSMRHVYVIWLGVCKDVLRFFAGLSA